MEIHFCGLCIFYIDIIRQNRIECIFNLLRCQTTGSCFEIRSIRYCMYPSIGSSASGKFNILAKDFFQGFFNRSLDGYPCFLILPARKPVSVVGDNQFYVPLHDFCGNVLLSPIFMGRVS